MRSAFIKGVVLAWAVVLGVAIGLNAASTSTTKSYRQTIYVQNHSTFVSDAAVKNALPAFQDATTQDFAPIWNIDAKLVFLQRGQAVPKGASAITLVNKGNVQGALAYHEVVNGVADSIIYVGTAKYYGYSWTVGFTHELWEMLVDPPAGAGSVDTAQAPDGTIWAQETADPVESDADGYNRPGANGKPVRISDFITEKWFGALVAGRYDFMDHIQQPLTIDKGGYAQWWDGITWHIIENFKGCGVCRSVHW